MKYPLLLIVVSIVLVLLSPPKAKKVSAHFDPDYDVTFV